MGGRVVGEQTCHKQDSNPGLKTLNPRTTTQVAISRVAEF